MGGRLIVLLSVLILSVSALEYSLATPTWVADYKSPRDSWSGLRVLPYFNTSFASDDEIHQLKTDIVPIVVRWFERVLKVPRLNINLKLPIPYCGQGAVPLEHQTEGVDADVVLYIVTAPFRFHTYDKFSYGSACLINELPPYRVLAGTVWVQMDWFNGLTHNKQVDLIAQHFAQALGFDSLLFQHFTKSDENRYEENELHEAMTMAGALRHVLTLPTVVEKARIAFNCPSLPGVRLSGDEYDDTRFTFYETYYNLYHQNFTTYLTLWSARMMLNDFMSDLVVSDRAEYSSVTMAVFQDSGWYEVDWNYTSAPRFAYKRGCDFFNTSCLTKTTPNFAEFCTINNDSCSSDFTSKGPCNTIKYEAPIPDPFRYIDEFVGGNAKVDYCTIMEKGVSCLEGDAEVTWEENGFDCRCFTGEYKPSLISTAVRNTHCHRVTCNQGKAYVKVGNETVECPVEGGAVSIIGFTGSLNCPSADRICKSPPCKNLCNGRGKCTNGECICDSGFYGEDCTLMCDQSCLTCTAGSQTTCDSCRTGAHLSNGQCLCSSQFTMNAAGECVSLTACHPSCLSCFASNATNCRTCRNPASLTVNNTCECSKGSTMNELGQCISCLNGCAKCAYPNLGDCLPTRRLEVQCATNQYLSPTSTQCENCFSPCASCSEHSIDCLSCTEGYNLTGTVCQCPAGRFVKDGQCVPCHKNCLTCSGSEEWTCTSCRSDSLLTSNPGYCVCRSSSSSDCYPCDLECLTCSEVDPFQCKTCRENAELDSVSKRCVCNDGFFLNQVTYQCDPCHHSCATCFGPTPDNCDSCITDYDFLDVHVCRCNVRRYLSLSELKCKNCTEHCSKCSSLECSECDYGFGVNSTRYCELSEGFLYDEEEGKAYPCPNNCSRCEYTVKPEKTCLQCKDTFVMDSNTSACTCPINTGNQKEKCLLCNDKNCMTCSSDLDYCYSCMNTYVGGRWWSCRCPSGTYEVNHTCQACVQNCSTCIGPEASNCTSCKDGFYLRASSETTCATCHPWCFRCNGPNSDNCTDCWSYSSFEPGVVGKCFCKFRMSQTTCYHLDSRDKCDPRCLECYGPSHRECSSCNSTTSVLKRYSGGAACECLPDHRDSGTCWPCNYECAVCNDNGTCKSCFSWTRMSDTNPGICLCVDWSVRYYPNPDIFRCSNCNRKCLMCTGPYENNCTSCIQGVDLQPDHTCKCRGIAAMAPDGTCFTRNFFCLDEYCDKCRGLAIWGEGEYHSRQMGACYCPAQTKIGTGLYPDSMAGICHKCGPLCQNCTRDTRMCWACKSHSHLSYINLLGAPGFCECDKGYFVSYEYEECLLCQPGCTACKSETECTGCEYGYELSTSGDETHCECFSDFCKCPVGLNAVSPFDNCEERCHTGFKAQDRKCIATDNTKFVFTPVSIERETADRSESLKATFGNPNIENIESDETSPIPIYQNGLFFRAGKSAYITITGIDEDLILGPVHYIELWQRGSSLFSIKRGDGSTFQYDSSNIAIKLRNKSAPKRYLFKAPSTPVTTWTLIRYEVQAYKYRQGTRVRMYSNNMQTFEQIVLDYYYRDDAFDRPNSALTIGTNVEMLLGDFVIANRLWAAELTPACGCTHCTIAGSCLTDCGPMEYLKEDRSCGQCEAACTLGCVRGNDCSRNVDLLCDSYSNFTGCRGCKELAALSDGVCGCQESSSFQSSNNTCTCNAHYENENKTCEFVPDHLCLSYTSPPMCQRCKPRAELIQDFCTCISHSTLVEASDSCECDSHYVYNGTHCIFDPLCETQTNDGDCMKCRSLASYDGNLCKCIAHATQTEDLALCLCDETFKIFENKCFLKFDPLCMENSEICTTCKEMAKTVDGICECSNNTHFDKFSTSCLCEDRYAVLEGSCLPTSDLLCAHLQADRNCSVCKGLAIPEEGSCKCIANATLSENGLSCHCSIGLKPYENQCITANDPLCTLLDDYICKSCAPLSTLVHGLCQCISHASFINGKCVCDPLYAQYQGNCILSNFPLCAKLSSPGVCEECQPLATMKNDECICVDHSFYIESNSTCVCDFHYVANGTFCEFDPDPLCNNLPANLQCEDCKLLSHPSSGICQCDEHASNSLKSDECGCEPHYALFKGKCVETSDELCAELDRNGNCQVCKPPASLQRRVCLCVNHATYFQRNSSCVCNQYYTLTEAECELERDPLCLHYNANDGCVKCEDLSEPLGSRCQCVAHSHKTEEGKCTCDTHYIAHPSKKQCDFDPDSLCLNISSSTCLECKPHSSVKNSYCCCDNGYEQKTDTLTCELFNTYLLPNDVEVELSADFSQVLVIFAGPVDAEVSCKSIFLRNAFTKFGSKASCRWSTDRTTLSITLDDDATLVEEELELNATITIQSQRQKYFQTPNFVKKVKYNGKKAPITAILKTPPFVSLGCSSENIILDAKGSLGGMGTPLLYKWNIMHSAVASLYTEYSSYSSKGLIKLNVADLLPGTLLTTVAVKDRLGSEDSASSSIELTEVTSLSVEFDVGSSLNLTSDTQASVRAGVSGSCGQSGQRSYTWSYEGASPALPSTDNKPNNVLLVSKIPSTLIFEKAALSPGYTYIYKVKVTQGSLSGSAQLSVKVFASDLRVRLSRASGSHPADVKFVLSAANSRDPDNSPGDISYQWKCLENNNECIDANGTSLLSNTTKAEIIIETEKLKVGSLLKFTVTISKDSRSSSASAEFNITSSSGITFLLPPFYQSFLRHHYLAVVPKIETKYQTFFKWQQVLNVSDVSTTPDSALDASYLAFFANRLSAGQRYHFEMTAATNVGTMKQQVSFYVISEPEKGNTIVDPVTGREVLDWFDVSSTGWSDKDGNLPLTYQFCAQLSSEVCFNLPQLAYSRKMKFTAGSYSITAKVYNSLGGLGQSTSQPIIVEDIDFYRRLGEVSIQQSFLSDIEDPEATFGMIAIYCESLPLESQFFSFVTATLIEYTNSLFEIDLQNFEAFLGTVGSMTKQNSSRESAFAERLLTLTGTMMERYNSELNEALLSKILSLAATLTPSAAETAEVLKKSALTQFYRNRLPSASPFTFSESSLKFSSLRQLLQSLSEQHLTVGDVSVSIPNQWLNNTNLTTSDVVDLQLTVLPGNLSLTVKVGLVKSGMYEDYNVQFLEKPMPLSLFNATTPFNISLPCADVNDTEIECVGLDESGQWNPAYCTIVGNSSNIITISARSITTYTLRSVAPIPEPPPKPIAQSVADKEDEEVTSLNPTPLILASFFLVAGIVAIIVTKFISTKEETEQKAKDLFSPVPNPKTGTADLEVSSSINQLSPNMIELTLQQSHPTVSCFQYHALVHTIQDRSELSIILLAFLVMTEIAVLGLCYTFWSAGDESVSDAGGVFSSYSGQDMVFVAIAVAIGTVAYSVCVWLVPMLKSMGVILCGITVLVEFAGVVVMNCYLSFGPGGRWGEGALWAIPIQFLLVETVKTALVSVTRRISTHFAAKDSVSTPPYRE